jgi:hypothetical protein
VKSISLSIHYRRSYSSRQRSLPPLVLGPRTSGGKGLITFLTKTCPDQFAALLNPHIRVTNGLDPLSKEMDCGVKPGNEGQAMPFDQGTL